MPSVGGGAWLERSLALCRNQCTFWPSLHSILAGFRPLFSSATTSHKWLSFINCTAGKASTFSTKLLSIAKVHHSSCVSSNLGSWYRIICWSALASCDMPCLPCDMVVLTMHLWNWIVDCLNTETKSATFWTGLNDTALLYYLDQVCNCLKSLHSTGWQSQSNNTP